ncbi:MAG: glycosyltransferase, partial [Hyphomicrobium sp.]
MSNQPHMPHTQYTIGTLVTNPQQYAEMRASFASQGFGGSDCEYIAIDNTASGNGNPQTDAYRGLNQIINQANGKYVILCHQDVVLLTDGREELDRRLLELSKADANWGLAGNAGATGTGKIARRISDKWGSNQNVGTFPQRVMSLDENFIIVRRDARIGFSNDLQGFHLYGTDICLNADIMGYTSYVIDFHLKHLGAGTKGKQFEICETAFRNKWRRALRTRHLQTPSTFV